MLWAFTIWGFLPKLFRLQTKDDSFLSPSCPCCHTAVDSKASQPMWKGIALSSGLVPRAESKRPLYIAQSYE